MKYGDKDRMPDLAFRMMSATMALKDLLFPSVDKRVEGFGIRQGMTVVDYGCGPGRYTIRFARRVGGEGKVYAVDVHELALASVRRKMTRQGLSNVAPVLAKGYHADIPDHSADMIFVLDMIFGVKEPTALLSELHRIAREDGVLVVDDGHQPREKTIQMIHQSGRWTITEESRDHLRCVPMEDKA